MRLEWDPGDIAFRDELVAFIDAYCPPEAAALFVDRAERIAQSLEMGIAVSRGQLLRRGERLDNAPAR